MSVAEEACSAIREIVGKTTGAGGRRLEELPIEAVMPTEDNPRIIDDEAPSMKALMASITASGVIVPVHCRPTDQEGYELLAGERRLRASLAAGRDVIPAIIHEGLSDAEAFEITFTENFQREDLTALEESRAVGILLARAAGDVEAVASKMGWTPHAVRLRAAIDNRLSAKWKKDVAREKSSFREWTPAHLEEIARLPETTQNQILEELKPEWRRVWVWSVAKLRRELDEWRRLLSTAPWNLTDAGLVRSAPACSTCKKRTSAEPLLWGDTPEIRADKDCCLDFKCWLSKRFAYLAARAKELRKEHKGLVGLCEDGMSWQGEERLKKKLRCNVVRTYNVKVVGPKAKGAMPALAVDGKRMGKLVWIAKARSQSSGSKAGPVRTKTLAERRETLKRKRWNQVLEELRPLVESTPAERIVHEDKQIALLALVSAFGTKKISWQSREKAWKKFDDMIRAAVTMNEPATQLVLLDAVWEMVRKVICEDYLDHAAGKTQTPDRCIKAAREVGVLLGIDVKAMFADVSKRKGFTEPKSWKKLAADEAAAKAKA